MSSQLDEFVQKLGRFDSIVDAHEAGDMIALRGAIESNLYTHNEIIRGLEESLKKYRKTQVLLARAYLQCQTQITENCHV